MDNSTFHIHKSTRDAIATALTPGCVKYAVKNYVALRLVKY